MTKEQLRQFFGENPEATEAYEALGVLFSEKEKADAFMGGVHGVSIRTHVKEQPAGGDAGQQPNGNTITEGTDAGATVSPSEQTNETGQQTGTSETSKKVEDLKAAIESKQAEIDAAKGFGKTKPKKELAELEKALAEVTSSQVQQ